MPALPPRLSRPTLAMLPRVSDQIGFIYVDRARVERDDNGVHAIFRTEERGVERVYLPTASIAALLLGPGTSITQPAAAQTMRDGAVIILSGESGSHFHGAVTHNDLTTKWLHLQAEQWADPDQTSRDSTTPVPAPIRRRQPHRWTRLWTSCAAWRATESRHAYRTMSQRYGIPFRRAYNPHDYDASDPVNQALTTANQVLYGVVHSVVAALGASPALGFIHTGGQASFVYDIADLVQARSRSACRIRCRQTTRPRLRPSGAGCVRTMAHAASDPSRRVRHPARPGPKLAMSASCLTARSKTESSTSGPPSEDLCRRGSTTPLRYPYRDFARDHDPG